MKYSATSQRQLILSMAILFLAVSIPIWHIPSVKWVSLTVIVFCILNAFLTYQVALNKHTIRYTIQLFGLTIYSKEIVPSNIKKIIFKRIGWKSKLAAIKVHKGIPIRVAYFKPDDVYEDLIVFCEENAVPYHKTKDYTIIEKMG
ncbi:hypothetical protein LZ480_06910 [Solibacillus sp. MA9]|uniref:PH domain-containing protein n=1 Tax=Solibacillus palustris TaxID=2908203 RepID=A0ABS9UBA8_9BACL|nr:hypothetical protein [Solibacillus sp. MA9]MCH7321622.1 hypothetical protein [Solibacillus sp. MA9]